MISNNKISKQRILFFQMINKINQNQTKNCHQVCRASDKSNDESRFGLGDWPRWRFRVRVALTEKKKINKLTICIVYHRQIIREYYWKLLIVITGECFQMVDVLKTDPDWQVPNHSCMSSLDLICLLLSFH